MAKTSIGVVGCGNMGGAILKGLALKVGYELYGWTRTMSRLEEFETLGVHRTSGIEDLARKSRFIILAVKPCQLEEVLAPLSAADLKDRVVVSVAAGVSLATLAKYVKGACPVVRCMPNTPAVCGKGVFALAFAENVAKENRELLRGVFAELGMCLELEESKFTAFSALIGAGPAYVFDLMEGMVMAGVTLGFTHAQSREMVEALFEGCAVMATENRSQHLTALRDAVCSPAGLTIAGVNSMGEDAISAKLLKAVLVANERGREMEK